MAKVRFKDKQIIDALQFTGGLISPAARRLGCNRLTIYNRCKKNPKLKMVVDDARAELADIAESSLRSALNAGESWAIILTLKTIGKDRGYVERQEITGADGGALHVSIDR